MTTETKTTKPQTGISRRSLLKTGAAAIGAAAGSGLITGFPTIWAQSNITLRQFGTGVSNINAIAEQCKKDLGITLEMTATDSDAAAQRAVTQPDSYDIADIEYWILKKVYPTGVIQPMDVKKLKYYDKVVPLFKNGKMKADSVIAQGTAPHRVGYVESADAKTFAKGERAARTDDGVFVLDQLCDENIPNLGRTKPNQCDGDRDAADGLLLCCLTRVREHLLSDLTVA